MESQEKTGGTGMGSFPPPNPPRDPGLRLATRFRPENGRPRWRRTVHVLAFTAMFHGRIHAGEAPQASGSSEAGRQRIEASYAAAEQAVRATNSVEHLWQLGRAAFDRAAVTDREKLKAQFAEVGLTACRGAIRADTASAPAHYYLALCLGELARTKTLGALRLVREMENSFLRVRALDDSFDYAGADRGLGLLYLETPGWPTSIGDRKKARTHLERAVALAPGYPGNRVSLAELLVRVKDHAAALQELAALETLWPAAREKLSGEAWIDAWTDWDSRKAALEARLRKNR